MEQNSKDPLSGCVFVDSQNVYYTLKKWINKALPEQYIDWDKFFGDVFQKISKQTGRSIIYDNSYWFRPTKFIGFYPEKRMIKYHLSRHFDEAKANEYLDKPDLMKNQDEKVLLDILFRYERGKDIQLSKESNEKYKDISDRYRKYFNKNPKMNFIETGFIKYDFIKKERNEKAVDVSLASHLLFCAMASDEHLKITQKEHIRIPSSDVVVLLSNDDDYIETVSLLEAIDIPIYVICFRAGKNQKSDLMDNSKGNRFIFNEEDMSKYISKLNKPSAPRIK